MAIQTATDLILDVVRAADPAAAAKAESVLATAASQKAGAAARTTGFAVELASAGPDLSGLRDAPGLAGAAASRKEGYQKFEAMMLQNFVKSMLPAENEEMFGKGTAGEIWKGMMAEQIGNVMAKGGGIGIADRMEQLQANPRIPADEVAGNVVNQANTMVNEMQMAILGDLVGIDRKSDKSGSNQA
ncbi:rod binding protein [Hoeflea marina]|uniref:Rod binding protein n=1 Tax=Hoeflea marina TaxID=274592 RepID=A0A317PFZ7_9HYPH|nr:rod-binding protein [Hoeflea marina]PWV95261.1 rod binding protein [Hoeflea marina]